MGTTVNEKMILVTGISGFIAKHCALELLTHGYAVRGTVRNLAKGEETRATLAKHCDTSQLSFVEADLLADAGWADAMNGIAGALHLASPFPLDEPQDPDDLLRPAVDGTLRVLRAAMNAGVPRVVQTSSIVAVLGGCHDKRLFTEDDWTDVADPMVSSYSRSKTLAERAARDFVSSDGRAIHFSTINPGFVLGPVLDADIGSSAHAIQMLLRGKYPGMPRIWFSVVDVRDVARMQRLALESAEPSGGRYLAVSETVRFVDIARPIRDGLGHAARKTPRHQLPDLAVRLVALFDPTARAILPDLGFEFEVDNTRTRQALGIEFIPVTESAPAMASSLIELGLN
jgi:dihydroflavonol-4-reductase